MTEGRDWWRGVRWSSRVLMLALISIFVIMGIFAVSGAVNTVTGEARVLGVIAALSLGLATITVLATLASTSTHRRQAHEDHRELIGHLQEIETLLRTTSDR